MNKYRTSEAGYTIKWVFQDTSGKNGALVITEKVLSAGQANALFEDSTYLEASVALDRKTGEIIITMNYPSLDDDDIDPRNSYRNE